MHFFYSKTDSDASGSQLLDEFEFINDFGFEEYKDIRQKPLRLHKNKGIEICLITKGRYNWVVDGKTYVLLPGDAFITCPWQQHGSPKEVVDLGELFWVVITPKKFSTDGKFQLGNWSRIKGHTAKEIAKVLTSNETHKISNAQPLKHLFESLRREIEKKQFGYFQRVSNLVEEFLIESVRLIQQRQEQKLQHKNWFLNFETMLKNELNKKWKLEDMTQQTGVGITTLTQLVKQQTGYTPANYLLFLRIEKAKELLQQSNENITSIAYSCGFYSSQHFSSTFSKWVGKSPSLFQKDLVIQTIGSQRSSTAISSKVNT